MMASTLSVILGLLTVVRGVLAASPVDSTLKPCGDAYYHEPNYTCYDGNFLCPVLNGVPTLRCGQDCYLPQLYSCANGHLVYHATASVASPASSSSKPSSASSSASPSSSSSVALSCGSSSTLHLSSPPYENYFYSDCHSSSQAVVTSPQSDSNLTIIGPRLLVAWPAGNSGIVTYFAPQNGINGTLGISLKNSSIGSPLGPIYSPSSGGNATVGVQAQLNLNSSAVLTIPILGSIRTIRDFTEGPSILRPEIQNATKYSSNSDGGVSLTRLWLDNITTTTISFTPTSSNQKVSISGTNVTFDAGDYIFNASFNYPQLTQFSLQGVLSPESQGLITQQPDQTKSLAFLSYTTKLTAGAWRFLTYFGRDSMISALLMFPVLSQGKDGAVEAVIEAVLERINGTDGSVCHEETIGDYATWTHQQSNVTSTAPLCAYVNIDQDYYLPVLMEKYFVNSSTGAQRSKDFFSTKATVFPYNSNLTYADLALRNAERIIRLAGPFAGPGNQTIDNLVHLHDGEIVGNWRDSTYGIGGGRIPYDVNTALVPAALRALAGLSRAGYFPTHPDWATTADTWAQVWEDNTLQFFKVTVPIQTAIQRLTVYSNEAGLNGTNNTLFSYSAALDSPVVFHGLSLDGNNNQSIVQVMNSDDCFRHFLLNTTNQTQLTSFLNSTANNVRRTFPVGLMTDVSMLIANPAYGGDAVYAQNWTTSAYHGTVVWSWPLAMMAKGLELQLSRCDAQSAPDFCNDSVVLGNVKSAYNVLWDSIEANSAHLSTEVWSWTYSGGKFNYIDLGVLPPPPGQSPTESDIVQLWSLTFLSVTRNKSIV